jgi:L-alanine-DL-glutamate epimerase-like enolase superfamily enzyme
MVWHIRNLGRPGISSMAIAAVDVALWDLKSRLIGLPLVSLLGSVRDRIAVYGSGGFTSYDNDQLRRQFEAWMKQGITMFKMKIGTNKKDDEDRIKYARKVIGDKNELFIDANGAYSVKEALSYAHIFNKYRISWFEEPVSSDNIEGLHFIRDKAPEGMNIAAGEYGYDIAYFHNMLSRQAVDVLQADATRCAGITGFLKAGMLCEAYSIPFSAHTAPSVHMHPCCALNRAVHIEYFHDHERIEHIFFDGAATAYDGCLRPDLSRPGLGLELKEKDASRFLVS